MRTRSALALVALLALTVVPVLAQDRGRGNDQQSSGGDHANHAAPGLGRTRATAVPLRVAVDGSRTPDLISDALAYRHFILIASERAADRADASAAKRRRRAARIAGIGLSDKDGQALTSALASVRERLDAIATARQALPQDPPREQIAELRQRELAVLDGATARLKAFLTPAGRARLERHLRQQVKKNIVVYGD